MVDTKVFDEAMKQKHLDAKTEAKIRKLLKNAKTITQQQATILQKVIDGELSNLAKVTTLEQLQITSQVNIFTTTSATELLIPYQENMSKMFQFGLKFSNKTPSSTVKLLEEGVKQSTMTWITRMGEDLKARAGQIVANGFNKGSPVNDVVAQLEEQLNITRALRLS